ncbi:MAG TPA: hypothetical protein VJN95_17465 [Gemmatimonadales bacterium]|nr:hypothetical protein [Gemmatimonadales bacterium]
MQGPPDAIQVGRVTVVASRTTSALAIQLAEAADPIRRWPGLGTVDTLPITLVLVPDSAAMSQAFRGRAPGWGAGFALPATRTIILRADLPDVQATLHHELAHLALHAAISVRVPLWFDEGYAAWSTGEWERLEYLRMGAALAGVTPPTLTGLDGMLRGSARTADVAYALATSAIIELARRNPSGLLDPLLNRLREGVDFDTAVQQSTGLSLYQFEDTWQHAVRVRYNLVTWLLAGGFWSLAAGAVILATWYRRRADRPRRAALDIGWVVPVDADAVDPDDSGG